MSRPRTFVAWLLAGVALAAAPAAAITGGGGITVSDGRPELSAVRLDKQKYGTACTSGSANTALATALTDAVRTVVLPAGCTPRITTPGAGNAAVTIPSGKRIVCEDKSAGFIFDTGFAPTGGSVYKGIVAASSSDSVELIGCSLWANGVDDEYTCANGSNPGTACLNTCTTDTALRCTLNAQCPSSGTCTMSSACTGGGTCTGPPATPTGAGKITAVDFSASTRAVIVGNDLWDLRRGDAGFVGGIRSLVRDNELIRETYRYAVTPLELVSSGISIDDESAVESNRVYVPVGNGIEPLGGLGGGLHCRILGNHLRGAWPATSHRGIGWFGFSTVQGNTLMLFDKGIWPSGDSSMTGNAIYIANEGFSGCSNGATINGNLLLASLMKFGTTDSIPCGGFTHCVVTDNFIASFGSGPCIVGVGSGKRCANTVPAGSTALMPCTTSANCNGETCVAPFGVDTSKFSGNQCLTGGMEFNTLSTTTGTLSANMFTDNYLGDNGGSGGGLRFPTGAGDAANNKVALNTTWDVHGLIPEWTNAMGELGDNFGVLPSEEQHSGRLRLTNKDGAAMVAGEAVAVYSATGVDHAVRRATSTREVIGVVLTTEADGSTVQVLREGQTTCVTTDVATTRGDWLRVSGTAGRGEKATAADDAYAVASAASVDQGAYHTVKCVVRQTRPAARAARVPGGTEAAGDFTYAGEVTSPTDCSTFDSTGARTVCRWGTCTGSNGSGTCTISENAAFGKGAEVLTTAYQPASVLNVRNFVHNGGTVTITTASGFAGAHGATQFRPLIIRVRDNADLTSGTLSVKGKGAPGAAGGAVSGAVAGKASGVLQGMIGGAAGGASGSASSGTAGHAYLTDTLALLMAPNGMVFGGGTGGGSAIGAAPYLELPTIGLRVGAVGGGGGGCGAGATGTAGAGGTGGAMIHLEVGGTTTVGSGYVIDAMGNDAGGVTGGGGGGGFVHILSSVLAGSTFNLDTGTCSASTPRCCTGGGAGGASGLTNCGAGGAGADNQCLIETIPK